MGITEEIPGIPSPEDGAIGEAPTAADTAAGETTAVWVGLAVIPGIRIGDRILTQWAQRPIGERLKGPLKTTIPGGGEAEAAAVWVVPEQV